MKAPRAGEAGTEFGAGSETVVQMSLRDSRLMSRPFCVGGDMPGLEGSWRRPLELAGAGVWLVARAWSQGMVNMASGKGPDLEERSIVYVKVFVL